MGKQRYYYSLRNNFIPLSFYTVDNMPMEPRRDTPVCCSMPFFYDTDVISFGFACSGGELPVPRSVTLGGIPVRNEIIKVVGNEDSVVYLVNLYPTLSHRGYCRLKILYEEVGITSEGFVVIDSVGVNPFLGEGVLITTSLYKVNYFSQVGDQVVRLCGRIEPRLSQDDGETVTYMNGYKYYVAQGTQPLFSLKLGGSVGFDFKMAQHYGTILNSCDVIRVNGVEYEQGSGVEYQYPEGYDRTTLSVELLKYELPRMSYYLIGGDGSVLIDEHRNTVLT